MDSVSWGILAGAVGALVTAAGTSILRIMTARYQHLKETRLEAIAEYKGLVDQLRAQTNVLQQDMGKLHELHTTCREENAEFRGEIRLLQYTIHRLQVRTGDELPPTLNEAQMLADGEGTITKVNVAAQMLFHYKEQDLVGKNVKVLIPERFHADHDRGLKRIKATGIPPLVERVILSYGLTKEGDEIPVAINLSAFVSGGKWVFGASIRRRDEGQRPPESVASAAPGPPP
jgi:PAS domain S-box-containing protein